MGVRVRGRAILSFLLVGKYRMTGSDHWKSVATYKIEAKDQIRPRWRWQGLSPRSWVWWISSIDMKMQSNFNSKADYLKDEGADSNILVSPVGKSWPLLCSKISFSVPLETLYSQVFLGLDLLAGHIWLLGNYGFNIRVLTGLLAGQFTCHPAKGGKEQI